jgi:hypothetical protein
MAASEDDEEIVTLQSSDGQNYTVSRAAAFLSETIQHLVTPFSPSVSTAVEASSSTPPPGLLSHPRLLLSQKEDTGSNAVVPLPNVHSRTLSKVLEYCKKHVTDREPAAEGNGEKESAPSDESAVDKSIEEWDKVRGLALCRCPSSTVDLRCILRRSNACSSASKYAICRPNWVTLVVKPATIQHVLTLPACVTGPALPHSR